MYIAHQEESLKKNCWGVFLMNFQMFENVFSNSLILPKTKEILNVRVFGNLIVINISFE